MVTNMITDRPDENTYYNYTDLNRVEAAAKEVAEMLINEGYYVTITVKTNWAMGDLPPESQLNRYLQNLHTIQRQFRAVPGVTLPVEMRKLTYIGANNIEKFLEGIPPLVADMISRYRRCNTFNCGT